MDHKPPHLKPVGVQFPKDSSQFIVSLPFPGILYKGALHVYFRTNSVPVTVAPGTSGGSPQAWNSFMFENNYKTFVRIIHIIYKTFKQISAKYTNNDFNYNFIKSSSLQMYDTKWKSNPVKILVFMYMHYFTYRVTISCACLFNLVEHVICSRT
jgi:hypothetical protein